MLSYFCSRSGSKTEGRNGVARKRWRRRDWAWANTTPSPPCPERRDPAWPSRWTPGSRRRSSPPYPVSSAIRRLATLATWRRRWRPTPTDPQLPTRIPKVPPPISGQPQLRRCGSKPRSTWRTSPRGCRWCNDIEWCALKLQWRSCGSDFFVHIWCVVDVYISCWGVCVIITWYGPRTSAASWWWSGSNMRILSVLYCIVVNKECDNVPRYLFAENFERTVILSKFFSPDLIFKKQFFLCHTPHKYFCFFLPTKYWKLYQRLFQVILYNLQHDLKT